MPQRRLDRLRLGLSTGPRLDPSLDPSLGLGLGLRLGRGECGLRLEARLPLLGHLLLQPA